MRRAERIGDDAMQAFLEEGGRDAEHRLGAEPGGEHRRRNHVERQVAAGHGEVLGVVTRVAAYRPMPTEMIQ